MSQAPRTVTRLPNAPDIAVRSQFQQHQVATTVGDSYGLNPNAGNLANTFSQFFSSLAGSVGKIAENQARIEMIQLEDQKRTSRMMGATSAEAAKVDFSTDAGQYRDNSESGLTEQQKQDASFMAAYRGSMGRRWGNELIRKIEGDLTNVPAAGWAEAAQAKYQEFFGKGTGDAYFDSQIASEWNKYYEQRADVKLGEANATVRAEAQAAVSNEVVGFMRGPNAAMLGQDDFDGWVSNLMKVRPDLGPNAARAEVVKLMAASVQGKESLMGLQRFLHDPYVVTENDGQTTRSSSFAELFPAAAAQLSEDAQRRYDTQTSIEARQAWSEFGTRVTEMSTMRNWRDQATAAANLMAELPTIEARFGNSNGAAATYMSELVKTIGTLQEKQLNLNGLTASAQSGVTNEMMTSDNVKNFQRDWVLENADFLAGKSTPEVFAGGVMNHWNMTATKGCDGRCGRPVHGVIGARSSSPK